MENQLNMNIQELKVHVTRNLNVFKFLKGNRPPNPQHIKRLSQSIVDNGMLCNPILVNEKYEIIDGQHRLLAAKAINSPIYYIIINGYALNQVHALNINQKNWTKKEFLEGYVSMGLKDYIILKNFWLRNKWLQLSDVIALCSGITSSFSLSCFKAGTWVSKNMEAAEGNALRLKQIEPYFQNGYNSSIFVGTMLGLFNHKNYEHSRFLNKLKIQPLALAKCATREQYKILIEDIYNYRSRDKVSLRY
jgi:hypothetical protein